MKPSMYLDRLHSQLKGFSAQEQADFLDELADHIQSGEEDPSRGADETDRQRQVMAEMGSPEQMGRGLRDVHRPNRLMDLLLALGPYFIFAPLIRLALDLLLGFPQAITPAAPFFTIGGRLSLLIYLALTWVGWRRRSTLLTLFWAIESAAMVIVLMTRETRWIPGREAVGSLPGSILFYLLLAGLLFWLLRLLRQNHWDLLLVVYTLLPFCLMAANLAIGLTFLSRGNLPVESNPLVIPSGLASLLFYQVGWAAANAIFFLARPRDLRWFGLLWVAVTFAYPQVIVYRSTLPVLLMWSALLALVLLGWALDGFARRRRVQA